MINNLPSLEELEYIVKDDYFPRQNRLSLILPVQWDQSTFASVGEILSAPSVFYNYDNFVVICNIFYL